jgi:hypothetical protein
MVTRTYSSLLAHLLFLGGSACSSGSDSKGSASLLGDWLLCDNADCSEVADDGYRFLADGTALHINAEESLVSAAPLCIELEESAGAYEFDGTTLTLEGLSLKAELDGDLLTVHDVPVLGSNGYEGVTTSRLRRLATYEGTPCPER